jgi:hypothetical protein
MLQTTARVPGFCVFTAVYLDNAQTLAVIDFEQSLLFLIVFMRFRTISVFSLHS